MTMYLSNPGVGPTGFEPAEFIEVAPMTPTLTPYFGGTSQHPTSEGIAYIPVRVTDDVRANGSVTVYLRNGTALNVSGNDLLRLEPAAPSWVRGPTISPA